jgi:hypothetical protein
MNHHRPTRVRIPIREEAVAYREPPLDDILSDSIVEAMMQADAVDPDELRLMLRSVARSLRTTRSVEEVSG